MAEHGRLEGSRPDGGVLDWQRCEGGHQSRVGGVDLGLGPQAGGGVAGEAVQRGHQESVGQEASPIPDGPGVGVHIPRPGLGVELGTGILEEIDEEILNPRHVDPETGQVTQDRPLGDVAPEPPPDLWEILAQHVLGEASEGQIPLMKVGSETQSVASTSSLQARHGDGRTPER